MHLHSVAIAAGLPTPKSEEAHGSGQTAGFSENQKQQPNLTAQLIALQAVPKGSSLFCRLESQFAALGLNLYPLDGDAVLVASQRYGMSRVIPDLRTAQIYLRQIGGSHG